MPTPYYQIRQTRQVAHMAQVTLFDNRLRVEFDYAKAMVDWLKASIGPVSRRYDATAKLWWIDLRALVPLVQWADHFGVRVDPAVRQIYVQRRPQG